MARMSSDIAEEEFPDVLPHPGSLAKQWVWNSESNTLEQVSTGISMGGDKTGMGVGKRQKSKPFNSVRFSEMQKFNQKITKINPSIFGSRMKNATSPRPSTKANRNENRLITLSDVKGVAYDLLSEAVPEVSLTFRDCLVTEQFDNFLMTLLYYFEAYFERQFLENKPRPMATEPSVTEKLAMSSAIGKQTAAQKLLAAKYCTLILGLGIQEQHHMACGKHRSSYTRKDRSLYETLYTFSSFAVWICFRRKDYEMITQEIGRQFRSDSFNPAGRPIVNNDFKLASDLTKQEDPDFNLAPYSVRQRKKRPAIQSIINQRSPVLVSLLPTSTEASPWLLDRRKGLLMALGEMDKQEEVIPTLPLKIGIIGEPISGFNPINLAPFGEDHEEDEDNQRTYSSASSDKVENEETPPDEGTLPNEDENT